MRLYFVLISNEKVNYEVFTPYGQECSFTNKKVREVEDELKNIFDRYGGAWEVFNDKQAAEDYINNIYPKLLVKFPPIYEVTVDEKFTESKTIPFYIILEPFKLKHLTISKEHLVSVTINGHYYKLHSTENRDIAKLKKYLFSFKLNEPQKKAALELINCLIHLKEEDADKISDVVYNTINYIGDRTGASKESYEETANTYLTLPSEELNLLGKSMLAISILFVAVTAIAIATTPLNMAVVIPAAVIIPTIGLCGASFFARGYGGYQTRLSRAAYKVAEEFETIPNPL